MRDYVYYLSLSLCQYSTRGRCSLFLCGIGNLWIDINPEELLVFSLSYFGSFT